MRNFLQNLLATGLVALCSVGLLSMGYEFSQNVARAAKDEAASLPFLAVLPEAINFTECRYGNFTVYEGKDAAGALVGLAFITQAEGFGGPIDLMIGVDPEDAQIVNIQVLSQTETPGLGDQVVKPEFTKQFQDKSLDAQFEPGVDIDGVSGATISSRAVAQGVQTAAITILAAYRGGEHK